MYQDFENDIAIIKPLGELENVIPAPYKLNKKSNPLGTKVYFMGHPDELDFFLIQGMISRVYEKQMWLHSLAWGGASGAVVFDETGKILGVLNAVKVAYNPILGNPVLLEDFVLVARVNQLDKSRIKSIMENE